MRRRAGLFLMELGTVLIILALALFLYNQWEAERAWEAARQTAAELEELIEAGDYASVLEEEAAETVIDLPGGSYIGLLSLPRFGLELPVMAVWSYEGLKTAPGRYSGRAVTGDLVICGHNYERHFGKLSEMERGDSVVFTSASGMVYTYEVTRVTTIGATAVEELLSGDWDLSLLTCTTDGQARVVVRCTLTQE